LTYQPIAAPEIVKVRAFVAARIEAVAFHTMYNENLATLNYCFAVEVARLCYLRLLAR
jgi:hypothetical protein